MLGITGLIYTKTFNGCEFIPQYVEGDYDQDRVADIRAVGR